MYDFKTTCQICGKEYDNYMRTFYVEENSIKTRVCLDCRKKLCHGKHIFTNHIPPFCDGGDIISRCFNTEKELLNYILSSTRNNNIACMSDDGTIIDVSKEEKYWWVRGYSTLESGTLPDWKVVSTILYGG